MGQSTVSLLLIVSFLFCLFEANGKLHMQCLSGTHHKKSPSPEKMLYACQRYNNFACCNSAITKEIALEKQRIGNFSWNLCGRLSPECHKYMRRMECFYQCEPYVGFWRHNGRYGGIDRAPICSTFCNNWYEACKDDRTCVRDWLNDFVFQKGWKNKCPEDAKCRKFRDVFANGKDMCEGLWGDSLAYSHKDCFDVDFEGMNPNWRVVLKELELTGGQSENVSRLKLVNTNKAITESAKEEN